MGIKDRKYKRIGFFLITVSLAMLLSHTALFYLHKKLHHNYSNHVCPVNSKESISEKHDHCLFCDLLVFSGKSLHIKSISLPDLSLKVTSLYISPEVESGFFKFYKIRARSPPSLMTA